MAIDAYACESMAYMTTGLIDRFMDFGFCVTMETHAVLQWIRWSWFRRIYVSILPIMYPIKRFTRGT